MKTTLSTPLINRPYIISEETYVLNDRPLERQPAQRLQREGAEVLDISELLQLSLGRGDALEPVLHEYGTQFLTTLHSVNEIVERLQVDRVQATRLLAILELGRRLFTPSQGSLVTIRGIEDVFEHYRFMTTLTKEQLRLLLVNSRYQLIHEEVLAIGSIETVHIAPRDVFQSAIERRVVGIILVHNHPSGDPTPSQADYDFSSQLQQAGDILGIKLLDHVIIAGNQAVSSMPTSPTDRFA